MLNFFKELGPTQKQNKKKILQGTVISSGGVG